MKQLNHYLFKRALAKQATMEAPERKYLPYEDIKRVLILFESDYAEKNSAVRHAVKQLITDGKRVEALGFVAKKQIETPCTPSFSICDSTNIGWFGKPKKIILDVLQQKTFDVVIDLTVHPKLELHYLLLTAKAHCKLGKHQSDYPLLDFMIEVPAESSEAKRSVESDNKEITLLFEQILYYLKSIRTIK